MAAYSTRHTNAIRSILWQPESNVVITGGVDRRVGVFVPHHDRVSERIPSRSALSTQTPARRLKNGKKRTQSIAYIDGESADASGPVT